MNATWQDIVSRICPLTCREIDDLLLTEAAKMQADGSPPAGSGRSAQDGQPTPCLWPRKTGIGVHIGVRVDRAEHRAPDVALRLAAAAAERGVIPVIFSAVPQSGFEEFGFRVERLPAMGDPDRELVEAELRAFWDISVVVDASDVHALR